MQTKEAQVCRTWRAATRTLAQQLTDFFGPEEAPVKESEQQYFFKNRLLKGKPRLK